MTGGSGAIQGARDAGATEFVVSDSMGTESRLDGPIPNDIPITVVRSLPVPGMMEDRFVIRRRDLHRLSRLTSSDRCRAHTISALLTKIRSTASLCRKPGSTPRSRLSTDFPS
jgi:hypothetical protein